MDAYEIIQELEQLGDETIAGHSRRYFKAGRGEYGEGDHFLGIRVPLLRKRVRACVELELSEVECLLQSSFHEVRLFALLLLVEQFKRADCAGKSAIYELYLRSSDRVNNWDLVDSSAQYLVGAHLQDKNRAPLYELARSDNMWERRIAVIACFYFIKHDDFEDALRIGQSLLGDNQALIRKAVGWMLREIGKRDLSLEKAFLTKHYASLPRTTLRYAIERFPAVERERFLNGNL
ncbi:DNA alkylation repair protein [Thiomicrorhabdus sp.]|uniref:DNA alkylation repair protein n=1 Tax=Thiomicrorhabdus sp. TaxID=2039724 RepID=UPI0029C7CA5E|nr:DNA alkylation repair protein [Thiomicrorhabdus sp.]